MVELHRELIIAIEISGSLGHDATPLLLVRGHNSKCRFQPLIVQFRLFSKKFISVITITSKIAKKLIF